jgi:hypothetical protein
MIGNAIGSAIAQFLFGNPASQQEALQKQQMMEELQRRQAEAERQHRAEEAQRLAAMYNRLLSTLKLEERPNLQLKQLASASTGLKLKLGDDAASDNGQAGIKGLPGIALNDGRVPYGIPGLPGIYVGGPGEETHLTNTLLTPQAGAAQGAAPPPGSAASVSSNAPVVAGLQLKTADSGTAPAAQPATFDPSKMSPQQLADVAEMVSKLPPAEQQRLMAAAQSQSPTAPNAATTAAQPTGQAMGSLQQQAALGQAAVAAPSAEEAAMRSRAGFDTAAGPLSTSGGQQAPAVALRSDNAVAPLLATSGAAANTAPASPLATGDQFPPREYKYSGDGLIGGTKWIYYFNVPPGSDDAVRARAEQALRTQNKVAGTTPGEFVDSKNYNFILGMAASRHPTEDLLERVLADNPREGMQTVAQQAWYASLRNRQFDRLDCHSNGAMICLAALTLQDAKAEHVRLFGPQMTRESLADWQALLDEGKVKDVKIYINRGDPVPGLSYLGTQKERVLGRAEFADSLGNEIHKYAPGVKVQFNDCPPDLLNTGIHTTIAGTALNINCHDMRLYQKNVDSPTK